MGLLGAISQLMRSKYAKAFEKATQNPRDAQWQKLKAILAQNAHSEYGQKYHFSEIDSIATFQSRVPVAPYSDLKPYLDRMVEGEKNILTTQEPIFYGMTTGSSGPPKLTPITPAYREEYQEVVHTFLYHVYRDHPRAFNGKVLYFNGNAEKSRTPTGIPCGTMSGFNFINLPNLVKKFYALPYEVSVISQSWTRQYVSVLLSLPQNITMMIGITGAPIINLMQTMQQDAESLINDLRHGTLHPDLILTDREKILVMQKHRPHPDRADELAALLQHKGILKPTDVWPDMALLICWKSSHAGCFISALDNLFENKIPIRDAIYSATEGWCNIPTNDKITGGPLAVQAHFYEFFEENDKEMKQILLADQLETGKRYRILYTTSAGMYRYDIGDILEVVDMYYRTPSVKFIRKSGQTCNMVGELMTEHHITEAIMKTMDKLEIPIPFYTAVPVEDKFPPYYDLIVELPENINHYQTIIQEIEHHLCRVNCDYRSAREDQQLAPLHLKVLTPGSHQKFRQQQIEAGADEAQLKPIVLSTDRSRFAQLEIAATVPHA